MAGSRQGPPACTFAGNSAIMGGGMRNEESSPTLTNCTFEGNSADAAGGGMYNYGGSAALTGCTFEGNSARIGGGVANRSSSPSLTGCTFKGNSASGGAGISGEHSSPTLINCTFEANSARYEGGGMYNFSGSSPALTNCTFSGNSAGSRGGGMSNVSSSPALTNSILWEGSPDEIFNEGSSPIVTFSDIQGGYDGVGNIDADPRFVDPDNGDFHLGLCSPAVDAGDNTPSNLPLQDFEGDGRIVDGDGDGEPVIDMGVDEVAVARPCLRVYLPLVLKGY